MKNPDTNARLLSRETVREALPRAIAVLGVAGLMALAACHTTAGAGKDISAAGNAISNSAENHTSY
jgi:predicted small secreted protein